ncbi:unnamed protein product [Sphenostylis stenocarpa]|uniref:Uncharacterized protein n=1 Tax=Sphenostylis stenocarpa TaxID=92480 RepID=A0AA86S8R7_9FABA|nr:unnamed protein product [Sphenostylis stenocarpa]
MLKIELAAESDMRKKVDGFTMFSNGKAEDMKEANIGKRNLQSLKSELKYDLRKSLAWDSAFSTSSGIICIHMEINSNDFIQSSTYSPPHSFSGILEVEELFNTSSSLNTENSSDMLKHEQYQHLYFNNRKPEIKTVTDGFNLRKSLAWDSAFSTSEGILNPEELSLLDKGFKKSGMGMLPQIEELRISSESNRTIDSDGSSLASIEISVRQSREASNSVASCCRNIEKAAKRIDKDCVPKLKVKSRPTSTMQTTNGNQPERTTKESSVPPPWKFSSASGRCDLSSHLKPPKIQSRAKTPIAPTKRIPLFSNEVNGGSKTVEKNFCFISPSVSIDGFSPATSVAETIGSHDGKGINSLSFDASRTVKPSGLRMPSPKIGFFDVDNLLVSIKNRDKKSHSKGVSKIQSGQKSEVRNTRTCTWKTRNSNNSRTIKFGPGAVSKAGEGKDYLRNDEKKVHLRAHEHGFERKICENKILKEREEQSCLKGKRLLPKEQTRANNIYTGNDGYKLHQRQKENLIGFEDQASARTS